MQTTISLYRSPTGWIADMRHASGVADVRRALGTDQIPTPYTLAADPTRVLAEVSARNPKDTVVLR